MPLIKSLDSVEVAITTMRGYNNSTSSRVLDALLTIMEEHKTMVDGTRRVVQTLENVKEWLEFDLASIKVRVFSRGCSLCTFCGYSL